MCIFTSNSISYTLFIIDTMAIHMYKIQSLTRFYFGRSILEEILRSTDELTSDVY